MKKIISKIGEVLILLLAILCLLFIWFDNEILLNMILTDVVLIFSLGVYYNLLKQ